MEGISSKPESAEANYTWTDIIEVETAKGSTYKYLSDGTTQRFKKIEDKEYEPQSALVYVPDYAWVSEHAPAHVLEKLGENEIQYEHLLLEYVLNPRKENKKAYIIDSRGNRIESNKEIWATTDTIYIAFLTGDTVDFSIPVFAKPKIGFSTFDTRTYKDETTGEYMRERHLGNKVVRIELKSDT